MISFKQFVTVALLTILVAAMGFAKGATTGVVKSSGTPSVTPNQSGRPDVRLRVPNVQDPDRPTPGGRTQSSTFRNPADAKPVHEVNSTSSVTAGIGGGTYHIPSGTYPTIAATAAILNFVGIAGDADVKFVLDNASYTEGPVTFLAFPNAGVKHVIFEPKVGVYTTINFTSSLTNGKGLSFDGAIGLKFDGKGDGGKGMTLRHAGGVFPDSDSYGATVYITNGSSDITINNATIMGEVNNPVWASQTQGRPGVFIWTPDEAPFECYQVTLHGDSISNATYGVKVLTPGNVNLSVGAFTVDSCLFGPNLAEGILCELPYDVHVTGNVFDGITYLSTYFLPLGSVPKTYTEFDADAVFAPGARGTGFFHAFGQVSNMHFIYVDKSTVSGNTFQNLNLDANPGSGIVTGYGFRNYYVGSLGLGIHPILFNNRIDLSPTVLMATAGSAITGIRGDNSDTYHNSIRIRGTESASGASTCINNAGAQIKNNAFSNEAVGTASNVRGVSNAGTIDYNGIYSAGVPGAGLATVAIAVAAGVNVHGIYAPVNFDGAPPKWTITTGPSAAENVGTSHIPVLKDYVGASVDTTIAGSRDGGAYQFSTGTPYGPDAMAVAILNPPASVVVGPPVIPSVRIKNNGPAAIGPITVTLNIPAESYSNPVIVASLAAGATTDLTYPAWTPSVLGSQTATATAVVSGDVNAGNNAVTLGITEVGATTITTDSTWHWNTGADGWTGSHDWVRSSTFTKLGGPFQGASWVTNCPADAAVYSQGAYMGAANPAITDGYPLQYDGPNLLLSPWMNLSGITGDTVYVSFNHSIAVEPGWDGSWIEYTTNGVQWKRLGGVNDAKGINWFSTSVYANAQSYIGNPPDTVTMKFAAYALYGAGTATTSLPMAWWTSNGPPGLPAGDPEGDGHPQGPFGYVFTQLKITPVNYPDIVHAATVRFRYVAFSDAVNPPNTGSQSSNTRDHAFAGWAVDDFHVGKSASVFSGGTINGTVFNDVNGNGVNNAEPAEVGAVVDLFYFGVHKDTTVTNGSGAYSFNLTTSNNGLPGTYQVSVRKPGYAFTVPNPPTGLASINHPATGGTITQDFGTFQGSISGKKYNDLNNNGTMDGSDVGLAGFTISLHKDSCAGGVLQTAVTDVNGNYQFVVLPGSYYLSETQQSPTYRQTQPGGNCYPVTTSGNSGTGTAIVAGKNFGNYKLNSVKLEKVNDLNGDGIKEAGDVTALPVPAIAVFDLKKNGSHVRFDTLGNGTVNKTALFDTGSYSYTESFLTSGWIRTLPGSATIPFTVTTGGVSQTITYMNFKMTTLSGFKFDDKNGNGVKDSGEVGLVGWKINVGGAGSLFFGSTSATTDSTGFWQIDSVGGPKDTLTEVLQGGWTQTLAPAPVSAISGTNVSNLNFGNFKNVTVSGVKYRDRNANGTREGGEEGLSGWTINMTGTGGGSTATNGTGAYSFTDVGPGSHILTEVGQAGWTLTQPSGGNYTFSATSGVNQTTGRDFGNFKQSDSTALYRTFTSDEFEDGAQHKATKPLKQPSTKPYVAPNLQALMKDYFKQFGLTSEVIVGVPGVLNAGGKTKAYVQPKSYTDVFKSLWDKGITHSTDVDSTEIHRGLDVDNKGKQLLKRYKSLSPKKQKNDTFEELLVLACNIALSDAGKTTPGFSSLIYDDGVPGAAYNGMTVSQIMAAANNVMTNTDFVGLDVYARLELVASKINDAFSCGGVDCETIQPLKFDTATWNTSAKVLVGGLYPVSAIPYMKANPNAAPTTVPKATPVPLPDVYALYQNYPNPFNPTTTIEFDLPGDASVSLKIYNILGQEMGTLFNNEILDAGSQAVDFDASTLPSGVYFYRITAQSLNDEGVANGQIFTQVKKMMLIK